MRWEKRKRVGGGRKMEEMRMRIWVYTQEEEEERACKDTETHKQTWRKDGHVVMKAETTEMWPQAKECLKQPEAGRDRSILP